MPQSLTLLEYNQRIKNLMYDPDVQDCWVTAETSDLRVSRGHCYLELLQKDDRGATVARLGAVIWANTFTRLDAQFFNVTGKHLATGMKVMVNVNANFHEQYGLKAIINEINPEFTLGDMERIRQEIIARLTKEGIIDMNKQLGWGVMPQRIAIISASGAAGYGDFLNQLHNNSYGLKFYTCLFESAMQGVNTVPSVIAALDRIAAVEEMFDCVVIIRGGGSTSDLNSFDNYDLGANIAQFPLPIITGIGHDRDVTIPDMVSKLHVKTPTAAAEFLVQCGLAQLNRLNELASAVVTSSREAVAHAREQLSYYGNYIPLSAQKIVETSRARLIGYAQSIPLVLKARIDSEKTHLDRLVDAAKSTVAGSMERERMRLTALTDKVQLLSPQNILNRGYSLTTLNGHVVTSAAAVKQGDLLVTTLKDGKIESIKC
ncbi:MAG: exodeoxyribonuclease VII large subunit [Muribaculaceae bacterium]|nr:exodeoxyribonuclease VII large subunit [Muribaculaceae bacterium]